MTTSISSVNTGAATTATSSTQKKSSLSEETKKKLEALGITVTDDMTESQAASLINQAQQKDSQQGGEKQDSKSDIRAEAKTLAESIGIAVSDDAETDDILNDIGQEIELMLEDAENNPSVLSSLSSYLSELTNLDERYETLEAKQESMFAAMETIGDNKKLALGLS